MKPKTTNRHASTASTVSRDAQRSVTFMNSSISVGFPATANRLRTPRNMRHRRGFSMMMAIVVLGLVAMTLSVLAVTAALQAKRTRIAMEDAQLRQLLISGEEIAGAHLLGDALDQLVPLPTPLQELGATLHYTNLPGSNEAIRVIEISAALPRRHLSQHIEFTLHNGTWEMTTARLGN